MSDRDWKITAVADFKKQCDFRCAEQTRQNYLEQNFSVQKIILSW